MVETISENPQKKDFKKKITRRDFLLKVKDAAITATGAGLTLWAIKESDRRVREGIQTEKGTFYPIYELHDRGPAPEEFLNYPPLDAMSIEVIAPGEPPERLIEHAIRSRIMMANDQEGEERVRERLKTFFSKLAQEGTLIAFGDIRARSPDEPWANPHTINALEGALGNVIISLRCLLGFLERQRPIPRRKVLKLIGEGIALWLLSPFLGDLVAIKATEIETGKRKLRALRHLLLRLNGLQSHFHPENVAVFYRNLVWAIKLLNLAEHLSSVSERELPKIGFLVGSGHQGIEDLLILGKDFCYALLEAITPVSYRRKLAALNLGTESFAEIRLVKLPPYFIPGIPLSPEEIQSERIVDERLMKIVEE